MAAYSDTATAQFENVNSLREYPFANGSSLVDDSGRMAPLNAVVDLHMVVPSHLYSEMPVVKMSSLYLSRSMVSVCFASRVPGSTTAASVTVSAANFRPYFPYRLEKLSGCEDIGGVVTFGEIEFPGVPEAFRYADPQNRNSVVHPCCIAVCRPSGLRGITDPRSGETLRGDVAIDFSGHVQASGSGKSVVLSLAEGSASQLASKCAGLAESPDVCGATPIRSINGVRPDDDGNIVLWFH